MKVLSMHLCLSSGSIVFVYICSKVTSKKWSNLQIWFPVTEKRGPVYTGATADYYGRDGRAACCN